MKLILSACNTAELEIKCCALRSIYNKQEDCVIILKTAAQRAHVEPTNFEIIVKIQ